jgi:uncharacterized protein (DUF433 family)
MTATTWPAPAEQAAAGVQAREQLEMISADPRVMHGQAVIAGTRVPVSVILDCLAAGMTAEEITTEYPVVTIAGVRAAAAYGIGGERSPSSRYGGKLLARGNRR